LTVHQEFREAILTCEGKYFQYRHYKTYDVKVKFHAFWITFPISLQTEDWSRKSTPAHILL